MQVGETVTLTVSTYTDYELTGLAATPSGLTLSGTGAGYTFTMPATDVSIRATFQKTAAQSLWETVLLLIENAAFTLTQLEAPDADIARYALANKINTLLAGTGFTVSASDIVVFLFQPAIEGVASNPAGTAGRIEFRVSPANATPSPYNGAIITALPTGNEVLGEHAGSPLRAYVNNSV